MALIGRITFHLLAKGKRPMQRREFLAASTAAAVGLIGSKSNFGADEQQGRQFFELRIYHFASRAKQEGYEQFLSQSAIPAFNRAGIGPVGVFKLIAVDNPGMKLTADSTDLYVLLTHNSMESVIDLESRLGADDALQKSGQTVLNAPKSSMTRRSQAPRPRFLFCVECSSRGTDSDRDDEALVPVPRRWAVLNRPSGPVTFKLEAKGSHASENYVTPWACAWSLVPSTMNSCLPSHLHHRIALT
jgi:hypothetical protein